MRRTTSESESAQNADIAQPSSTEAEPSGLVATGKHSTGFLDYDDLGRPCWSWMNELDPACNEAETDDLLKALDTTELSLADEPGATPVPRGGKKRGYDPYDTARIKVGDRFRRR